MVEKMTCFPSTTEEGKTKNQALKSVSFKQNWDECSSVQMHPSDQGCVMLQAIYSPNTCPLVPRHPKTFLGTVEKTAIVAAEII